MNTDPLDPQDQHLLDALDGTPRSPLALTKRSSLGVGAVLGGLSRLEAADLARRSGNAHWYRPTPTQR